MKKKKKYDYEGDLDGLEKWGEMERKREWESRKCRIEFLHGKKGSFGLQI